MFQLRKITGTRERERKKKEKKKKLARTKQTNVIMNRGNRLAAKPGTAARLTLVDPLPFIKHRGYTRAVRKPGGPFSNCYFRMRATIITLHSPTKRNNRRNNRLLWFLSRDLDRLINISSHEPILSTSFPFFLLLLINPLLAPSFLSRYSDGNLFFGSRKGSRKREPLSIELSQRRSSRLTRSSRLRGNIFCGASRFKARAISSGLRVVAVRRKPEMARYQLRVMIQACSLIDR